MKNEQPQQWERKHAYGLPQGSIRALLALLIFGAIWGLLASRPQEEVPPYLQNLMFIIMGHYFASRSKTQKDNSPPPLFLPKGSVRWIIVFGFASVATILTVQNQWIGANSMLNPAGIALLLVAGFMLGVLRANLITKSFRFLEDLRATISLASGTLLILLIFGFVHLPEPTGQIRMIAHFGYEEVLAALVGFYFGSKS